MAVLAGRSTAHVHICQRNHRFFATTCLSALERTICHVGQGVKHQYSCPVTRSHDTGSRSGVLHVAPAQIAGSLPALFFVSFVTYSFH